MSRVLLILVCFGVAQLSLSMHNDFNFGPGHGSHHGHGDFHHGHGEFHHDHSPEGCGESSSSSREDSISKDRIIEKYSNAESAFRKFCETNNKTIPKIVYGQDAYILKYALPNQSNLNITVKAVTRIISTEVKQQGDFQGFQDMRILPEMLDLQRAFWSIEQSNLKITLPYRVTISAEFNAVCEPNYGEVNIPGNLTPNFKVRMFD